MGEIMKLKAKTIWTPCGTMSAPFNPNFGKILENCKTNEDLFALVDVNGFIDSDALNEVCARDLYNDYQNWKRR